MQLVAAACRRKKLHVHCNFEEEMSLAHLDGDNHIQNFHLGGGGIFGDHVLRIR